MNRGPFARLDCGEGQTEGPREQSFDRSRSHSAFGQVGPWQVIESRVLRVVIKATHPPTPDDFCPQGLGLGFASGDTNPTLFGTTDTCLA